MTRTVCYEKIHVNKISTALSLYLEVQEEQPKFCFSQDRVTETTFQLRYTLTTIFENSIVLFVIKSSAKTELILFL